MAPKMVTEPSESDYPAMTAASGTLLVNFWYAHPVGHAIEALRYCLGYHRANPAIRVSLLLNGATPAELAELCPFIEQTYAVSFTELLDATGDPLEALSSVPRTWDYIVDDARGRQPDQLASFAGLDRFYKASDEHFRAKCAHTTAGSEPPAYAPHQELRLELPGEAREKARDELGASNPWIAVMPAGSGAGDGRYVYPSLGSWEIVLRELEGAISGVRFCLVGKLRADQRTSTAFRLDEVAHLREALPGSIDAFDRPLIDQLALVEACDLFLSPHTGFGMAALAVATPWLTLSGGRWPEWFFNGVPFHSVLPQRNAWFTFFEPPPALPQDEDGEGPRTPSMTRARIREDLPELVDAARLLIEGRLTYDDALRGHFTRLVERAGDDMSWLFSFDSIHARYI